MEFTGTRMWQASKAMAHTKVIVLGFLAIASANTASAGHGEPKALGYLTCENQAPTNYEIDWYHFNISNQPVFGIEFLAPTALDGPVAYIYSTTNQYPNPTTINHWYMHYEKKLSEYKLSTGSYALDFTINRQTLEGIEWRIAERSDGTTERLPRSRWQCIHHGKNKIGHMYAELYHMLEAVEQHRETQENKNKF